MAAISKLNLVASTPSEVGGGLVFTANRTGSDDLFQEAAVDVVEKSAD